jgi:hypothetical protein
MTGVLRWVPQGTVIGTVIKVFRFFHLRTRRHAGAKDRNCLRVLCSFVCIARCMANDDGSGIAQQQNAFKQLSTGQWDVSTTFFCFPSVSHRTFASLPCCHISYSLCAFFDSMLVLYSQVSSVVYNFSASLDIDRCERNVLASCCNVLPTHLHVGSISNLSALSDFDINNKRIRVKSSQTRAAFTTAYDVEGLQSRPVQPQRHGVHSAVESKNSCPVPVTSTLILVHTYLPTPAPPSRQPAFTSRARFMVRPACAAGVCALCGRGTAVRSCGRQTGSGLRGHWESRNAKRLPTVELAPWGRPRRQGARYSRWLMRNHREARRQ